MAKRNPKADEANRAGSLDSGPVKVTWIRIVEHDPKGTPFERVLFQAIEDGATSPISGYFDLVGHADWASLLVESMEDDAKLVELKIDMAAPFIAYKSDDVYLTDLSIPSPGPESSVHFLTGSVTAVVP